LQKVTACCGRPCSKFLSVSVLNRQSRAVGAKIADKQSHTSRSMRRVRCWRRSLRIEISRTSKTAKKRRSRAQPSTTSESSICCAWSQSTTQNAQGWVREQSSRTLATTSVFCTLHPSGQDMDLSEALGENCNRVRHTRLRTSAY